MLVWTFVIFGRLLWNIDDQVVIVEYCVLGKSSVWTFVILSKFT